MQCDPLAFNYWHPERNAYTYVDPARLAVRHALAVTVTLAIADALANTVADTIGHFDTVEHFLF